MTPDPVVRLNLCLGAIAVTFSLALATPGFAASVALGAVLETANFRTLHRSAGMFFGGGVQGGGPWVGGFGLRFALLTLAVAVALWAGVHPVGLVLGLSLIVPAVVVVAWRNRPPIVACPPAPPPEDESWDGWNPWLARERVVDEEEEA